MQPLADWRHAVIDVPDGGLEQRREATPAERASVAEMLAIEGLNRLASHYQIRRIANERYRLTGTVEATVTQLCVVSLEPVQETIATAFDESFWPDVEIVPSTSDEREHEALALIEPEPIRDGAIDVGRIVYETLAAALDPYPRKAGAAFEWHDPGAHESEQVTDSPFAALIKLRQKS